uniref:Uncharacterized protein n=1 Tax=Lepeophtheirus salmonis TaxID=72036 RepID=A0A0K2TQ76_LEPSM
MEAQEFGNTYRTRNIWLVRFVDINVPLVPCLELNGTHYPHLISRAWIFIYKITLMMNTSSQTLTLISQRCLLHVIYPYPLLIILRSKVYGEIHG